jgi:hypothetical protein
MEMMLASQMNLGEQTQGLRNQAMMFQARNPMKSYTPDIPGMQELAQQEATLNAANSQALERAMSPDTAALRQALPKQLAQDLAQSSGAGASSPYTQQNLARLFGSGMQDSTIGKSAYFDLNTAEGMARRQQAEQAAQNYLAQNQAPNAGLDPGALVSAQQAARAQAVQNANANRASILGSTQANLQSTSDWINNMMGNESQAINASQQNWQNYQQALYNAAAQNAANQNATTGALIGAAGTIGGAALGGPMGAMIGGSLAKMGSNALLPSGGYNSMESAQSAAPYAAGFSNVPGMGYVPRPQGAPSYQSQGGFSYQPSQLG